MTWPKLLTLAGTLLGGGWLILEVTFGSLEKRVESIDNRLGVATGDIKKIVETGGQLDFMEAAIIGRMDDLEGSLGEKIDESERNLEAKLDGLQRSVVAVGASLDEVRARIRMSPDTQ